MPLRENKTNHCKYCRKCDGSDAEARMNGKMEEDEEEETRDSAAPDVSYPSSVVTQKYELDI